VVPLQRPQARHDQPPVPVPQRARAAQPAGALRNKAPQRLAAGLALTAALFGLAGSVGAAIKLDRVATFDQPVYVHGPKGAGKITFVVEQAGKVKILRGGRKARGAFLDIRGKVACCGERGLLSIAFPDFDGDRRFYVYFTDNQGDLRVVEYKRKRSKLKANRRSARNVLEIRHRRFANHNGGQLQFGPDGLLYVGTGDGGSANDPAGNAQDKNSLLGKILRINPLRKSRGRPYGIPRSNPYVRERGRDEVFSRGLRNPWRFSFDGHKLAIGDVGQDRFEEVDYERMRGARGANFGWDAFEGNALIEPPAPAGHVKPVFTYGHGRGCTIIGGYVVRDRALGRLRGRYVYTDLCQGQLRSLKLKLGGARKDRSLGLPRIDTPTSFGVDARKRLYVASLGGGVHRFERK
jgi:glucose/arabinose dehydrogenase